MTEKDILAQRLYVQQLNSSWFTTVGQLISWFGAIQSQDYQGAKWAIGQRLSISDKKVEESFNNGEILRTHVMRPTWHFISPEDIVWMQALTSTRVGRLMNYYNKKLGLNGEVFKNTQEVMIDALQELQYLTRTELSEKLNEKGLSFKGQALGHVVMQAELDGILCSGPRRGKQFTYALIEERAPHAKKLSSDESLELLVRKYFQSHGPATIRDFCWWSGLSAAEAKLGIEMNRNINSLELEKNIYYFFEMKSQSFKDKIYLLPNYDEYGIAYKLRDLFLKETGYRIPPNAGQMIFSHLIIYEGKLLGLWRRTFTNDSVDVDTTFFHKPKAHVMNLVKEEIERYKKFIIS